MRNKNSFSEKFAFLFLGVFIFSSADAQLPNVEEAKLRYPDASAIYLSKKQEYKIYIEKDKLQGECSTTEQIFINKESGLGFQKKSIPSNSFVLASKIEAYTLVPKNKKYEKKKVEKIELNDDPGRNSFYDDQKSYDFTYPSVQPGAVLSLSYQLKYLEPRFIGNYYFVDYVPCRENELVVSVQKGINIDYKIFNGDNANIVFSKEEKKNEVIYRWKVQDPKLVVYYSDAPNFRYYEPHIIFYVTDYLIDGTKKELLGSTKNLYSWYSDLQKNLNKTEDASLKKIVDSLVVGTTSEIEKVNKIFYWVQDHVSYVAFEDGLGGFVPRDAGMVCSRKFGDCKDMASIIHEMLRMAGVPSYLTWIGSRDIPYKYEDVATPSVDNHMITTYRDKDGVWNFLDATGKHASRELYTSFIQGKQALVGISADSFLLVTVPVKDTSVNQTIDSIDIQIKDNLVVGKGKVKLTGYDQLNYLYNVETMSQEERITYFKNIFAKGNNKVDFSDISSVNIDRAEQLVITYNFKVADYARKNQGELYINLNMDLGWDMEQIPESRIVPMNFKHKTKKRLVTTLTIPDGYKVDFIPKSTSFGNDVAGFSSSYSLKGNKIILVSDIYFNVLILEVKDFTKFNKVLSEHIKASKQAISLIKL